MSFITDERRSVIVQGQRSDFELKLMDIENSVFCVCYENNKIIERNQFIL